MDHSILLLISSNIKEAYIDPRFENKLLRKKSELDEH